MDLFSFLATIILITSVVTLVMALAAYIAYKVREARKPNKKRKMTRSPNEPIFLKPAVPHAMLQEWRLKAVAGAVQQAEQAQSAREHSQGPASGPRQKP